MPGVAYAPMTQAVSQSYGARLTNLSTGTYMAGVTKARVIHSFNSELEVLEFFRDGLKRALESPARDPMLEKQKIAQHILGSFLPYKFVQTLLDFSVEDHRGGGLDFGTDVLSFCHMLTFEQAAMFLRNDYPNWKKDAPSTGSENEDKWYVILRALGMAKIEPEFKLMILRPCLENGTPLIREAAVEGLAAMNDSRVVPLLRIACEDSFSLVRTAASEALADLEE